MKPLICFVLATILLATANNLPAQGTAFTYQGRLNNSSGGAANGSYDFQFAVFDNSTGGAQQGLTLTTNATAVSNGLFTVTLDFGATFTGANRWLEIGVRTNGVGGFIPLLPRQPVTPAPYAIYAAGGNAAGLSGTLPAASLAGIYTAPVNFNNPANQFTGSGLSLTTLNASQLAIGTVPLAALGNAWKLGGNTGANPTNGIFLGTTDNFPLEFNINGERALRLEYAVDAGNPGVNVIGGYSGNLVSGARGATIGGGGDKGSINQVTDSFGVVSGGRGNSAGFMAVVAGGDDNAATGFYSTIPGGANNTAAGMVSFAAGYNAQANHEGAFVWADYSDFAHNFASTADNQFLIRAAGGVAIGTNDPQGAALRLAQAGTGDGLKVDVVNPSTGSRGVDVSNLGVGPGVFSESQGGNGVWGITHSISAAGVIGDNSGGGESVVGRTTGTGNGAGVGAVVGRNDLTNGYGVRGFVTKNNAIGVVGQAGISGGINIAGKFENVNAANTNDVLQVVNSGTATGNFLTLKSSSVKATFAADGSLTLAGNINAAGTESIGGSLFVDSAGVNSGALFNAPSLKFGLGDSGEGIASRRTVGGNQFGLDLYTGYNARISIANDGSVGIGRLSTANKLEVEGNASKTVAGSWLANSDRRIKQDIQSVTGALDTLNRVRLVSFLYTDQYRQEHPAVENRRYLNVVAQEFAEVFPDHVKSSGEKLPDGSEILQVDTWPVTIYSAAAIQELDAKQRELRAEKDQQIGELKAENADLKARLEKLERLVAYKQGGGS